MKRYLIITGYDGSSLGSEPYSFGPNQTAWSSAMGAIPHINATEANVQHVCHDNYTIRHMWVNSYQNSIDGTNVITLRKNSGDTALTVTIPDSTTGIFEDTTHSASYADSDTINIQSVTGGTAGVNSISYIVHEVESASGTYPVGTGGTNQVQASATQYWNWWAYQTQPLTISNEETYAAKMKTETTFTNLRVIVTTYGGAAITISTRNNLGAGNLTLTLNNSGAFEDTTHSDVVAAGNKFAIKVVASGATSTCVEAGMMVQSDTQWMGGASGSLSQLVSGQTRYGFQSTPYTPTSESEVATMCHFPGYISNLLCYCWNFSALSSPAIITSRVNSGPGTQTISVNATGTFEDTTHTDILAATDTMNYKVDTSAAGSGSFVGSIIGFTKTNFPEGGPVHRVHDMLRGVSSAVRFRKSPTGVL